jgi:hypothetical protein
MPDILLREQQMRIKLLEDLLNQAHMIIKPERNKVVYRAARQAWCEQYESLGIKPENEPDH